jgi:ribosomal protein S16
VQHWFGKGAQPSLTVANLVKNLGGKIPAASAKALAVRSKVSRHPKPAATEEKKEG